MRKSTMSVERDELFECKFIVVSQDESIAEVRIT